MKIINKCSTIKYPFEDYCKLILSVVPKEDTIGISEIRFVDNFFNSKTDKEALGSYDRGSNGKSAIIEINIPNHLKEEINAYTFTNSPEVAALFLSKTIFHEIGHHVHCFKRHGIKKQEHEDFADKYTEAGYYHYLKLRGKKILSSYKLGSFNFIDMDKEGRNVCRKSRKDIIKWMDKHKEGILFPRN
jgi:hypothetical protein